MERDYFIKPTNISFLNDKYNLSLDISNFPILMSSINDLLNYIVLEKGNINDLSSIYEKYKDILDREVINRLVEYKLSKIRSEKENIEKEEANLRQRKQALEANEQKILRK
jgi:hypothetical protein